MGLEAVVGCGLAQTGLGGLQRGLWNAASCSSRNQQPMVGVQSGCEGWDGCVCPGMAVHSRFLLVTHTSCWLRWTGWGAIRAGWAAGGRQSIDCIPIAFRPSFQGGQRPDSNCTGRAQPTPPSTPTHLAWATSMFQPQMTSTLFLARPTPMVHGPYPPPINSIDCKHHGIGSQMAFTRAQFSRDWYRQQTGFVLITPDLPISMALTLRPLTYPS